MTMKQKIELVNSFRANGLNTFQAMSAAFEDADWDVALAALEDSVGKNQ